MSPPPPRISWIAPPTASQPTVPSWLAPPPAEPAVDELARLRDVQSLPPVEIVGPVAVIEPPDTRELDALRARVAVLEDSLRAHVKDLARVRERVLADAAPDVAQLAVAIAERIVGACVLERPDVVNAWVSEGLALMAGKGTLVVRASPAMAAIVGEGVVADATLGELECVVESDVSRVEVGVRARVDAVAESIGLERPR